MGTIIVLITVALIAGYAGSRFERSRSSSITIRDAEDLHLALSEMRAIFEKHTDAHKVINYDLDILSKNLDMLAKVVGLKKAVVRHNA